MFIFLFSISNIFLLINYQGIYWDDWVAYNQTLETMNLLFNMIQHGIKGDFYLILSKYFNHIYLFRLFTFFSLGVIGYLTYKILLSTNLFTTLESKLISFYSIIIPIYSSLVLISVVPFFFPILLFFMAFFLVTKYYEFPNILLRMSILIIFFLSFSTNSLLVFYGIVLIYCYYMDNSNIYINYHKIKEFLFSKFDFIILPILFFAYKSIYLIPYGLYNNYNKVDITNIISILKIMLISLKYMTIYMLSTLSKDWVLLVIALIIATLLAIKFDKKIEIFKKNKMTIIMFSFILFCFAVFPYAAVGKQPIIEGWDSRFSILLGIPLSMLYLIIIVIVSERFGEYQNKVSMFLISFSLILFTFKNISTQYQQNIDWFYQISFIENIKSNETIKNNSSFILTNEVKKYLAFKRDISFYELNGILKKSFGDTKRFMINPFDKEEMNSNEFKIYKQYNFFEWQHNGTWINISLKANKELNNDLKFELFYNYIFDYPRFLKKAKELTKIEINT